MIQPQKPANEEDRIASVCKLKILDTVPEERFDQITVKALEAFKVPISTISIVDSDREWYKSVKGLDVRETPREISFCGHAILQEDIMIVEDTLKDQRFYNNPMVVNHPHVRFYAGKSLYEKGTIQAVGVFCIKDIVPRVFTLDEIGIFLELAKQAEDEINRDLAEC